MDKPRFQVGSFNITPEHPSNWSMAHIHRKVENETLDGTLTRDFLFRKYKYILEWDAISKTDYDNIEDVIEYSLDQDSAILFTYAKWSQSSGGVYVLADISDRGFVAGSGNSDFYSDVKLTLTEVSAR